MADSGGGPTTAASLSSRTGLGRVQLDEYLAVLVRAGQLIKERSGVSPVATLAVSRPSVRVEGAEVRRDEFIACGGGEGAGLSR